MTPGVNDLVVALRALHARFGSDHITASFKVPGAGEHIVTVGLTGGSLLTIENEDGYIEAIPLQERGK
jgi:hypothetical protein